MTVKNLVIGILAHVDAGKTTLAESMLYQTGGIRRLGRVDHQDTFLDTYELEKSRGITIFSKQALMTLGNMRVTLLDTPGHVDFSAEMERTLGVLDYAILVISQADGVQGHVQTLWRLLKRYKVPVFLFINKMDQAGADRKRVLKELQRRLDGHCIDFDAAKVQTDFYEELALSEETLLESYLESGIVSRGEIVRLVAGRKIFPCYFGSALKNQGVAEFLEGMQKYMRCPQYPEIFGARVYKITRDSQGNRLTHMKITGGSLKVKMLLRNPEKGKDGFWEEKADQLRIYSGAGFEAVQEVFAGSVCAVSGLSKTHSGEGLGWEKEAALPVLEPVLTYQILLPPDCDVHRTFLKLKELEEEEPQLHIAWKEELNEIHAQLMGEVQIEILKNMIWERFGIAVEFGSGSIVYKETIAETVEGVGHFEPLRHYAEVHLILEPGEPGSGLQFESRCSTDMLEQNWQRLILTHLEEKKHLGVLTGAELTDVRIILASGRAHQKHTEGGDFRQATYRAVRQGLKSVKSILLEPVYEFRLEVPTEMLGRAMSDVQKMHGTFVPPMQEGEFAILCGSAPVVTMRDYQREAAAYTRGRGRLSCTLKGYEPCHNSEEIIEKTGYDSEKDPENPTGSVFCAHGAGFVVPWNQVPEYMHLESVLKTKEKQPKPEAQTPLLRVHLGGGAFGSEEKELEEIFNRTYGKTERARTAFQRSASAIKKDYVPKTSGSRKSGEPKEEYLLVDGYNIIFAWEDLKELAKINLEAARNRLIDILCNYQGYKKNTLILVFDAYKVEGSSGLVQDYHNIHVVYTKEAETADQYIEKTVHKIGQRNSVTVASSDALEQMIILGEGARRMSARNLQEEILRTSAEIRELYLEQQKKKGNYLFENLPEELADLMEEVRLGKKGFEQG